MIHRPVAPCRLRMSSASNRVHPQSLPAGSAAARTSQRVSAVLAVGSAAWRSANKVTPCFAADSVRRRLATRSKTFAPAQDSITTAPRLSQRSASAPARKAAAALGTFTIRKRQGSIPKDARPGAKMPPHSMPVKSCCTQSSHLLPPATHAARARVKPVAAGASPASAGKTSCKAPLGNPPFRQASAAAWPRGRISDSATG